MKRAPGCASAATRLWPLGFAHARNASSDTPSNRSTSSARLAAAIRESTPSATARLDEGVERCAGAARAHRFHREADTVLEVGDPACRHQEGAGVQGDYRDVG